VAEGSEVDRASCFSEREAEVESISTVGLLAMMSLEEISVESIVP
jgi:hypothetical protein